MALRMLGEQQGRSTAELVREAVAEWLQRHGVTVLDEDEWSGRLGRLIERRQQESAASGLDVTAVEHDVRAAIDEVRRARAAGRH